MVTTTSDYSTQLAEHWSKHDLNDPQKILPKFAYISAYFCILRLSELNYLAYHFTKQVFGECLILQYPCHDRFIRGL